MTRPKGVGRGRKGIPRGAYSIHDGMKLCKGPLHEENGEWLPATSEYFYVRKEGLSFSLYSVCKRCRRFKENKDKSRGGNVGYVPYVRMAFVFIELERRIGRAETARRLGWKKGRLAKVMAGKQEYLERATAYKVIQLLRYVRSRNEVRHRKDIRYGTAARGIKETLVPKELGDFNHRGSDLDNEYRRGFRKRTGR